MSIEYSVHIVWSQDDHAYIASVAELPGCLADGPTQEEALKNIREIAKEWIATALEDGRGVPPPQTMNDLEKAHLKFQQELNEHIKTEVQNAVRRVIEQIGSISMTQQSVYYSRMSSPAPELEHSGGSRQR